MAVLVASAFVPAGVQAPLVKAANSLAGRSALLDLAIDDTDNYPLFAGVILAAGVWFCFADERVTERARILAGTLAACFVAVASRLLQLSLPTHLRPMHDPALAFHPPLGIHPAQINNWDSFPSDTATLYFGLATVIFIAHRRLGILAYAIATVLSLFRVYLGYHYPSDLVGGAALGIFAVGLVQSRQIVRMAEWLLRHVHTALIYAGFFYVTYGAATLFNDVRVVASQVAKSVRGF